MTRLPVTRTVVFAEVAAIWLADAIDGDCDLEDMDLEPEPETDRHGTSPTFWRCNEDMEDEETRPGFLHRDGHWKGMPA